jgi:hypothetical protein
MATEQSTRDIIVNAIIGIGERQGSNVTAITKYAGVVDGPTRRLLRLSFFFFFFAKIDDGVFSCPFDTCRYFMRFDKILLCDIPLSHFSHAIHVSNGRTDFFIFFRRRAKKVLPPRSCVARCICPRR